MSVLHELRISVSRVSSTGAAVGTVYLLEEICLVRTRTWRTDVSVLMKVAGCVLGITLFFQDFFSGLFFRTYFFEETMRGR